jgi:hypothetical protein
LDYPARACIAEAFDIDIFVISVVDDELDIYRLGRMHM